MKQIELRQAQAFVKDAIKRSEKRHGRWRELEAVYKTGDIVLSRGAATAATNPDLITYASLDREVVNLVKPNIDILLASTLRHDPRMLAVPIAGGPDAEDQKHLAEALVQHFWRTERATEDLKDATIDMLKVGNGFLKIGWLAETTEVEPDDEERARMLEDRVDVELGLSILEDREPAEPEELYEMLPGTVQALISNQPFVSYVSPYDIFVPPNARRMKETRWVCQRVTLPIDEVQDNDLYNDGVEVHADTEHVGGLTSDTAAAEWTRQQEKDAGLELGEEAWDTATIFEFYDMGSRRLLVFQLGQDEALFEGDIPYSHRHPPFVHLRNHSVSGTEFWAVGDVEIVAGIQTIFNEFVIEQIDNARRSGNKYLIDEAALTDGIQAAIESTEPDVVVPVKTNNAPLSEVIQAVERKALSGDVYAARDDLERWMGTVLGINDFQAGGVGADRMSATAAAVVDGVASLRGEEKVWQVETAAAEAGLQMLLLMQEFLDTEVVIRITGQRGAQWETLTGTELVGEYLIDIESGSMTAQNPASREQKATRLITEIVPIVTELGFDPEPPLRMAMKDLGFDPDMVLRPLPAAPAEELPVDPETGMPLEGGGDPMAEIEAMMAGGGMPPPGAPGPQPEGVPPADVGGPLQAVEAQTNPGNIL